MVARTLPKISRMVLILPRRDAPDEFEKGLAWVRRTAPPRHIHLLIFPEMTSPPSREPRRLLDQVAAFKYVTVENAPIYRALVQVFYEARQRYVIEMRPAEVLARLEESPYHAEIGAEGALDRHLEQLVQWGNLFHRHDTAAVSRIEDFYRRSFVYNLSAVGEAAHRAVLEVETTVGRSGSLQATMLEKIRDTLRALAAGGEPDLVGRHLSGRLVDLVGRHPDLVGRHPDLVHVVNRTPEVRRHLGNSVHEMNRTPEVRRHLGSSVHEMNRTPEVRRHLGNSAHGVRRTRCMR